MIKILFRTMQFILKMVIACIQMGMKSDQLNIKEKSFLLKMSS